MKILSTQELKVKVELVAPNCTPSNYMLPKDINVNNIIINNQSAHERTIITEYQFRSYIKLYLRFLISPELRGEISQLIRRLTDYVWCHSHFHQELLEEVHTIVFLIHLVLPVILSHAITRS